MSQRRRDPPGNEKGSGRLERDLAQTRARLDTTIDALERRLSPSAMVDRAIAAVKEAGGGELGRNLRLTVRDHPIPVVLIGIGVAWLMLAGRRSQDERRRTHGHENHHPHLTHDRAAERPRSER